MAAEASDRLYELPLEDFTRARDQLANELKAAGKKDAGARVKSLRKPSLAAWAVNKVVRQDPNSIERLLALRDEIENSSNATAMRNASDERRRLISDLVASAESVLREAGHATSANTIQAVTQTLHAGDAEEDREDLRRGRLTRELSPSGFGGMGLSFAEPEDVPNEDPRVEERRKRVEALELEAEEAEKEAVGAEHDVAEAERTLTRLQIVAEKVRRAAEQARARAAKAREDLERR